MQHFELAPANSPAAHQEGLAVARLAGWEHLALVLVTPLVPMTEGGLDLIQLVMEVLA